jgi:hypothetical protein
MGAELFIADGLTDGLDEANCRFSQFCGSTHIQTLRLFFYTLCVPCIPFYIAVYTRAYRHTSSHGLWPCSYANVAEYANDFSAA